jgi:hypothetical protein
MTVAAALEAHGFHRHARGPWRRRRTMPDATPALPETPARRPPPAPVQEIDDILGRAGEGDRSCLPRLRELFALDPERMTYTCGDLAHLIEAKMLDMVAGRNLAIREGVPRRLRALKRDLAGPSPSPLLSLAVEAVALAWMDNHRWAMKSECAFDEPGGASKAKAEFLQKLVDRSHRRYMQSLKALAAVVRAPGLAIPLNVAGRQVVAGGPS